MNCPHETRRANEQCKNTCNKFIKQNECVIARAIEKGMVAT